MMTKQEALKKIEELQEFVENCDKNLPEFKPGDPVVVNRMRKHGRIKDFSEGDIGFVVRVVWDGTSYAVYCPRWGDYGRIYNVGAEEIEHLMDSRVYKEIIDV